ncbi:dipeptide ABC transporter ATP-binding protein [Gryllotalpicola reticulitermitis]|uniref:Dipeptide ABC transporter ATP-binding protein n=1 Tax=Gryllotalpicola reticulitermitis TaxID=1184153 RepID=A0ABV8QAQ9_9MICO
MSTELSSDSATQANAPARAEYAFQVENLTVAFGHGADRREVVKGVSFSVRRGESFAIVGESGSGKSVTARTLIGLTGAVAEVSASRLELNGADTRRLSDRQWGAIRGRDVGFILQDALVSLDALRPVGREIEETLKLHRFGDARQRRARVLEVLAQVGVPEPELRARQLPGQLSGGLRQRALIASAIALNPSVVIADEPTTALDVTVQSQIIALLDEMKRKDGALLVISHDLAVVSRLADRIAVMNQGVIVEQGPTAEVLSNPKDPYTQSLLDAVPSAHSRGTRLSKRPRRVAAPATVRTRPTPSQTNGVRPPIIAAEHLTKRYRGPDGVTRTVVDDVSFELRRGETLGVVGESGSGKTTVARLALAITGADGGRVLIDGEPWSDVPERTRRPRRRLITTVYQDPLSSFDPRWTVEKILHDAIPADGAYRGRSARAARALELLQLVDLGAEHLDRRPLLLSGGQRQRVAIARALAPEPDVIVCDESVSALDVSIQAQVLDLLADLQADLGLSYLFISHDLGVIHHVSDRILVMHGGRVVEQGDADEVFGNPQQDYTKQLLSAIPSLERAR